MRSFFVIVAALFLNGCVATGKQVTQEQVSEFVKGKTTYSDVVSKLGTPPTVSISADGKKQIMYIYAHAQARPASFIPIVGAFVGGADSKGSTAIFFFDKNNILENFTFSESAYGTGTGFSAGSYLPQTPDQPKEVK